MKYTSIKWVALFFTLTFTSFITSCSDNDDTEIEEENIITDISINFTTTQDSIALGDEITLKASSENCSDVATYTWSINDSVVNEGSELEYTFCPENLGEYQIIIAAEQDNDNDLDTLQIVAYLNQGNTLTPDENSSNYSTKVIEYLPAPGQYINEGYDCSSMEEANDYAQSRLDEFNYVSLGGFGGYLIVGFDHSIVNNDEYDFAIKGNAFTSSSEPAIVYVMQDANGDGLANDKWYQLRGSEYGNSGTLENYTVTYYKPSEPEQPVVWEDNIGGSGEIDYLGAWHKQDYYYPNWVSTDSYELTGVRLESKTTVSGSFYSNNSFDWGYADNYGSDYIGGENQFDISNAVLPSGMTEELTHIDFIKVQTGVNAQAGWLGENSPEVFSFRDMNMEEVE